MTFTAAFGTYLKDFNISGTVINIIETSKSHIFWKLIINGMDDLYALQYVVLNLSWKHNERNFIPKDNFDRSI